MFRNYMASALRNVARNRLYFYTNVIGLAVAITAALLIGLFVHDELTYERFIPNSANVYIVTTVVTPPEGHGPLEAVPSEPDVASWLKLDLPAVAQVARMVSAHLEVRRGDFISTQTVYWADPALFSILHLPVYAGTLKTALARPDGLVLTRSMARKYFGRDDPVGETLELGHAERATVTAVLEDLPSNTHLDVSMIASGSSQASAITSLDRTSMPAFGVKSSHRTRPDSGYLPSAVAIDVETSTGFRQFGQRFPATPRQRPACVGHSPGRNSNWPRAGGSGYLPAGSVCDEPESSVGHKPGARDPPCL